MKKNILITRLAATILLTAGLCLSPLAPAQTPDKTYTQVEEMPVFEGGEAAMMKFLGKNMRYPEDAQKDSVEGLVVIGFVVGADGSLGDAKILKRLSPSTDAEALRVVKLMDGKWQPGTQDGKAVAVKYTMPIRYALNKKEKPAAAPDRQPAFKGGQEALVQFISQNLKMPEEAKQEHLNARVVVTFTVAKDGSVSDIRLAQTKLKKTIGPGSDLDYMDATTFNLQNKTILAKLSEAAVAAVQATSGQWEPATADGQPVAAALTLPLQFLGTDTEHKVQPARQEQQPQKDASSPGKEALLKFLGKNLRYPSTSKQGTVTVYYELTDTGKIVSMIGPDVAKAMTKEVVLDKALTDEVVRVMKLANDQSAIKKEIRGQQSLRIQFRIDDGKPAAATAESVDIVVTKYK